MADSISGSDESSLSTALAALRASDVLAQNEGAAAAVRLGAPAVPGLLELLKQGIHPAQVMYALAEIGDGRAAEAFLAGLRHPDESVRAYAARGLARLGHPQALQAGLDTLDDAADPLHADRTPSVDTLAQMGLRAAPSLLDRLVSENEMTRLRAQRALEEIVNRMHGFQPGHGFPTPQAEAQARIDWLQHGNYDYTKDAAGRAQAAAELRRWLASLEGTE